MITGQVKPDTIISIQPAIMYKLVLTMRGKPGNEDLAYKDENQSH